MVALSGICVFITAFVCGLCLVGCIAVRSLTAPQNANNLMNAFIFWASPNWCIWYPSYEIQSKIAEHMTKLYQHQIQNPATENVVRIFCASAVKTSIVAASRHRVNVEGSCGSWGAPSSMWANTRFANCASANSRPRRKAKYSYRWWRIWQSVNLVRITAKIRPWRASHLWHYGALRFIRLPCISSISFFGLRRVSRYMFIHLPA